MQYILALLTAAVAIHGSPLPAPQGVTEAISPTASAPSGCKPTYSGTFGIAVMNVTGSAQAPVSTISDGQPQASTSGAPVSQISDGQPQASTAYVTMAPVTQISDGQIQATTATMEPVSQIGDGQIQNPTRTYAPVSQISDGQIQATTARPVSQISDGQIQATTAPAVSQISDGQIQASTATGAVSQISDGQIQASTASGAVSQISDGQIQATTASGVSQISDGQIQATSGVSQISDGQPQATQSASSSGSSGGVTMVACAGNSTLSMTLDNGVLIDSQGRTGYIASNFQFQFDSPPQAGAIYTSGWSVCSNGSLALGGSAIFYQCLSGDFYNLYNEHWASQCNAVTISALQLVKCE